MTEPGLCFELSPEQLAFQRSLRAFVDTELPKAFCREAVARDEFPRDVWERLARQGLFAIAVDPAFGGQGGGIIEQTIVAEQLARTMAGLIWVWGTTAFAGAKAIGAYGTGDQKRRFLPGVARGETLFSIALTEPGGGTDVLGAMKTRATKVDGGWVINGSKTWCTLAHVADMLLLVARTGADDEKPSRGISVFLCDAKAPGIAASVIPKLPMPAVGSCDVSLTDVFVPNENILGEVGRGWRILAETLNSERIIVAAQCCGALEGIVEDMVSYAIEREAFGKPIGQFQAVQHMIANAHIGLQTSRLLTYRAAWLQQRQRPCGVEATTAKIVSSELCVKAADDGMQILGGYGLSLEYDMQRYWRDMRLQRVAPINNEMGRNFIGESLGLPRSF